MGAWELDAIIQASPTCVVSSGLYHMLLVRACRLVGGHRSSQACGVVDRHCSCLTAHLQVRAFVDAHDMDNTTSAVTVPYSHSCVVLCDIILFVSHNSIVIR
jgi:hypothetical protein